MELLERFMSEMEPEVKTAKKKAVSTFVCYFLLYHSRSLVRRLLLFNFQSLPVASSVDSDSLSNEAGSVTEEDVAPTDVDDSSAENEIALFYDKEFTFNQLRSMVPPLR
jgi:hypothetical protein